MSVRGTYHAIFLLLLIRALFGSSLSLEPRGQASSTSGVGAPTRNIKKKPTKPIPITVISGFLGAGKTSLIQNLLNNQQGLRIAVIVNDLASVNIDSKLVNNQSPQAFSSPSSSSKWGMPLQEGDRTPQPAGIVQLENGCACCSLSEELLGSVSELVLLSDMRGDDLAFDHIVVELSGVADPKGVRAKFQEAILYDMPLMERVRLDTLVTLIDCSVFLSQLSNSKLATPRESPELFYRPGEEPSPEQLEQADWAEDLPTPLLEALLAGQRAYGGNDNEGENGVVDLLVSQCEIADVCLLNKVDLCSDEDLLRITNVVQALNPKATVHTCKHGEVELNKVLAVAGGHGVVESGLVDDHKDAVQAASKTTLVPERSSFHSQFHQQEHDHHQHSHSHDRDNSVDSTTCSDPSHSHVHGDYSTSESHSHNHRDHSSTSSSSCQDPDCTDPSHSHDHHSHSNYFGLGSFVYRARRPFHQGRLVSFLRQMPISRGLPPTDEVETQNESNVINVSPQAAETLQRVLRSKGFAWSAHSDVAAFYWSHAGISFELSCLGRWWATLARENWPPEAVNTIVNDFVSDHALEADPSLDFVGDRRQEIVFIGPSLGSSQAQETISATLDQCLLNDDEWQTYCRLRNDDRSLQAQFPNAIHSRMLTY